MDEHELPAKIAAFWSWFSRNAGDIGRLLESESSRQLAALIAPRLAALGDGLGWEVGPGLRAEYGFTLSPNGVRERLRLTDEIIAAAPAVDGWEFHSAKPPKQWDLHFYIGDTPIDARPWQYLLTGYNGGEFYDVTLVAPNLPASLREEHEVAAGYVLLDGLLGERVVIEKIGSIEVVRAALGEALDRLSDIAVLAAHLRHMQDAK